MERFERNNLDVETKIHELSTQLDEKINKLQKGLDEIENPKKCWECWYSQRDKLGDLLLYEFSIVFILIIMWYCLC